MRQWWSTQTPRHPTIIEFARHIWFAITGNGKINTVCDGLNNLLEWYITALTHPPDNLHHCCIMPAHPKPATISNLHRPSLFLELIATFVPLKHHIALVSAKIILYVKPIPVKPPYHHDHCHPATIQTKDPWSDGETQKKNHWMKIGQEEPVLI